MTSLFRLSGVATLLVLTCACVAETETNDGAQIIGPATGNEAPSTPESVISPIDPLTADELSCDLKTASIDPEGEAVSYRYNWVINSVSSEGERTLGPVNFVKGDKVQCTIYASDGDKESDAGRSDKITIGNTTGSIEMVTISPESPTMTDLLTCSWSEYSDPDDDIDISKVAWLVNGKPHLSTNDTLKGGFTRFDEVTCEVTPYDGSGEGPVVSTSVEIVNALPSIKNAFLSVKELFTGETIDCTYTDFFDPDKDSDQSTITWTVNGANMAEGSSFTGEFVFGDEVACTVTPFDGFDEGETVIASITVGNTPPVLSVVSFGPEPAYENDTLTCTPGTTTDADGASSFTYTYEWLVDGTVNAITSSTMDGEDFNKDQEVSCRVTPNDGTNDGEPYTTAPITISNSTPSLSDVDIDPVLATGNDTLTCSWSDFLDLDDDDDLSTIEWTVDGRVVGSDATLVDMFIGDDGVTCTVTPYDGEAHGAPKSATIIIQQGAPSISSVTITPEPAYAEDTISCEYSEYEDPDDDPDVSTILWQVNGVDAGADPTLTGAFVGQDIVTCTVTPSDGTLIGDLITAEIEISNTPPVLDSLSLTPDPAYKTDTLSCDIGDTFDADTESGFSYTYSWLVDGADPGTYDQTLTNDNFNKHAVVSCSVIVNDGIDNSEAVTSNEVIVLNSIPELGGVDISPVTPVASDTLTCLHADFTDDDADDDLTEYSWMVNGVDAGTGPTLSGAFVGLDEVICTATPYDGEEYGAEAQASITITNTPPVLSEVWIEPEEAFVTDTLVCTIGDITDEDDENLFEIAYEWSVNGVSAGTYEQTFETGSFAKSDEVSCTATPSDGTEAGSSVSSLAITIQNTTPQIGSVTITPDTLPTATDTLTCSWEEYEDADGDLDQSVIEWQIDGAYVSDATTLAGGFIYEDEVSCTITPFDGEEYGDSITATVVIQNSAPVISSVGLGPESPTEADILSCEVSDTTDADGNTLFLYEYEWSINGSVSAVIASTLDGNDFNKSDDVYCSVTASDGHDISSPIASNVVTAVNTIPVLTDLAITPDPATTTDDISVSYTFDDIDGDADQSLFSWSVDGVSVGVGSVLDAALTSAGSTIQVIVTPFDGEESAVTQVAEVVISNSAPIISAVTISPSPAYTEDDLICETADIVDPDGTATFDLTIEWTLNGLPLDDISNTLSNDSFEKNDIIGCGIIASDGDLESTMVFADPLTVSNSLPMIGSVSITPELPTATNTLRCEHDDFTDQDDDADASTTQWTINGVTAADVSILGSGFVGGDIVKCAVTPFDGQETGTPVYQSVTIDNTTPEITALSFTPPIPQTNDVLVATVTIDDPDDDTMTITYRWFVDGAEVDETGNSLDGAIYFDRNQTVSVIATPSDGSSIGAEYASAEVEVLNSSPTITTVSLSPNPAYLNDSLTCSWSGFNDPDGDTDQSIIEWYVNGTPAGTSNELSGVFVAEDYIQCRVTPSDGFDTSTPVGSSITISNSAPTISTVSISPDPAYAGDTLQCNWAGFNDADGDPDTSSAEWYLNGLSVGSGPYLSDVYVGGDNVRCDVTPFDGTIAGTIVSNGVTITNSAPTLLTLALNPTSPATNDIINAMPVTNDADGDIVTLTYAWFVNGTAIEGATGSTLDGAVSFDKGDQVYVTATPSDGASVGSSQSSTPVTVINSPATAPVAEVSPVSPTSNDDLVCSVTSASTDPDGDTLTYRYRWYVNDVEAGISLSTVYADDTSIDDEWTCSVMADDGSDISDAGTDSVTISAPCAGLEFDGDDSATTIDAADLSLGSGEFTIELLVNFYDVASNQSLISQSDGSGPTAKWALMVGSNTSEPLWNLYFLAYTPASGMALYGLYTGAIPEDRFVHIAVSREADNLHFFVDGTLVVTDTMTGDLPDPTGDLEIGSLAGTTFFSGVIDEVRISSTARYFSDFTPALEVENDLDTIAFWEMDEAEGTTSADSSGNNHDLTLNSPVWSGDSSCDAEVNLAPDAPVISINPEFPTEYDALSCDIDVDSIDPNGDLVSYDYSWTVNGGYSSIIDSVVSASSTAVSETWECTVTPNDGLLWGPSATDEATIIFSYPPYCSEVATSSMVYLLCDDSIAGNSAQSECLSFGGNLATINGDYVNDLLVDEAALNGITGMVWMGANDMDLNGVWSWFSGTTWSYTNWAASYPAPKDNIGTLFVSGPNAGLWASTTTSSTFPYICEIP